MSAISRVTVGSAGYTGVQNMEAAAARMAELQNRLSSGKRMSAPSDDPAGTVRALQLRGAPGKARYGVVCDAETNLVEVNGSGVNPGVFTSVDPANKVRYNGGDARTAFGTNVLSGVTS